MPGSQVVSADTSAFTHHTKKESNESVMESEAKPNLLESFTIGIQNTYKGCNKDTVLTKPSQGVSNDNQDNKEANLICKINDELISDKSKTIYTIQDLVGTGTFGQVFRCQKRSISTSIENEHKNDNDNDVEVEVAIKVIKNKTAYHTQGLIEISLIEKLNKKHNNHKNIVSYSNFTVYMCICVDAYMSICLYVYMSICLYAYMSKCLYVYMSICSTIT